MIDYQTPVRMFRFISDAAKRFLRRSPAELTDSEDIIEFDRRMCKRLPKISTKRKSKFNIVVCPVPRTTEQAYQITAVAEITKAMHSKINRGSSILGLAAEIECLRSTLSKVSSPRAVSEISRRLRRFCESKYVRDTPLVDIIMSL